MTSFVLETLKTHAWLYYEREVGRDNAREIRKLSQNCELLSERTKGTEVSSGNAV